MSHISFSQKNLSELVCLHMNELKHNGLLITATDGAVVARTKTTFKAFSLCFGASADHTSSKPPHTISQPNDQSPL